MEVEMTDFRFKNSSRRKIRRAVALLCAAVFGLSGCGGQEEEEDIIVQLKQEQKSPYTMTYVSVGDVVLTQQIRCTYRQVTQEDISFSVSGKTIEKVYVQKGDPVVKGQLLAELVGSDRQTEIEELKYKIARNELLLSYTDIDKNYERSGRWWTYIYQSSGSEEEQERLQKDLERIEQTYRYKQEDYQDQIDLYTMQLERILAEVAQTRIYAGMDGEVSFVKSGLKGSKSTEGERVIQVIDSARCLFTSNQTEYGPYFEENEPVEMTVRTGTNMITFEAYPYDMDHWEDRLFFELQEEFTFTMGVGTNATINLVLESREQVLCVPSKAVHSSEDGDYVYVLGENDIREVRWIETGLHGDGLVEVVSGLTEGESIILR